MLVGAAIALSGSSLVAADPKRDAPDYDGRGNTDTDTGSWALWVPRVVLAPLYMVNEYVIRRPLGGLVTFAERHHWVNAVSEFFTFGPNNNYVMLPTALFDFGLLPSAGVYFAADGAWAAGNTIRLHAATWGADWINATALDRLTWNTGTTSLAARIDFKRQADLLFFGIGPDVTGATRSRYGLQRFDAGASFGHGLFGESALALSMGVRAISYRPGDCCGDRSLDARIADGSLAMPDGYGVPYTTLYQRAEIALDTRAPRPSSATGGYLQIHADIRAIAEAGRFADVRDTEYLAQVLIDRQHEILARYLTRLSPLVDVHVVGTDQLCALDLARSSKAVPADQFHYRVVEIAAGRRVELIATLAADGLVCFHPTSRAHSALADNASEHRVVFEIRNGTAAGPLEIHAYDLGSRGMFVVGLKRPAR